MITSKIKSIKKVKKKVPVYDIIGVPKNHNFVANRMVIHNCDESANFASSADWAKAENKALRKKLAQVRTKHLFFILCFPMKVYKMEKTYLESFVNYWISLYGRGLGGIFIKDKNPVNDSWRLHAFTKLGSFNDFTKKSEVIKKLKKHPNFWKPIVIPKVPKKVYDKYLVVRERNVYNQHTVNREISKEDLVKSLLIKALDDIMTNDTTFTIKRIIHHLKVEYSIPVSKTDVTNIVEDAKQMVSFAQQRVENEELKQ